MTTSRFLLVDTKCAVHPDLPATLEQDSEGGIASEVTTGFQETLDRIAKKSFDALICWAERKDDLIEVTQYRKARPSLPILVLTSQESPRFRALAIQMGATRVEKRECVLSEMMKTLQLAASSGDLAREVQSRAAETFIRVQEMQLLVQENRTLTRAAHAEVGRATPRTFVPLLVEDDPNHALLMVRAFQKADVFAPLPIMKTGEETIAYLSKLGETGQLDLWMPSIILLDLDLPKKSGLEVLEWIRSKRALAHIPVVILSSSSNPDHVNRAYRLGAHSYLIKPTTFDALVELVARLAAHRVDSPPRMS